MTLPPDIFLAILTHAIQNDAAFPPRRDRRSAARHRVVRRDGRPDDAGLRPEGVPLFCAIDWSRGGGGFLVGSPVATGTAFEASVRMADGIVSRRRYRVTRSVPLADGLHRVGARVA